MPRKLRAHADASAAPMTARRWRADKEQERLRLRQEYAGNPKLVEEFWRTWGLSVRRVDLDSLQPLG